MGLLLSLLSWVGCNPSRSTPEANQTPPPEIRAAVEARRHAWTDPDPYAAWLRVTCEMAKILPGKDFERASELIRMVPRYAPAPSEEARRRRDRALGGVGIAADMEACRLLADPVLLDSARAANGDPSPNRPPLPLDRRRKPGEPPPPW